MGVSYRLKELRTKHGYKQDEICNILGMKIGTYRNYEQGIREMNGETLIRFANFYKVSTDYILGRSDDISTDSNSRAYMTDLCREIETACKQLNDDGLNKILEYALDLAALDKYKKGYIEYDNMAG